MKYNVAVCNDKKSRFVRIKKSFDMRGLYILFFSSIIFLSCSKDSNANCFPDSWLNQKKAEFYSCTCLTGIYQGNYLGQVVYEVRGTDPLCNGINIVYREDGTVIVNSGDQANYQSYLSAVNGLQLIWNCSKLK